VLETQRPDDVTGPMSALNEYQVRYVDRDGATITIRSLMAENLIAATRRAVELAAEVDAADFSLTPVNSHRH
jgi:hypothetical protein